MTRRRYAAPLAMDLFRPLQREGSALLSDQPPPTAPAPAGLHAPDPGPPLLRTALVPRPFGPALGGGATLRYAPIGALRGVRAAVEGYPRRGGIPLAGAEVRLPPGTPQSL